jgi:hypothetical protein
MDRLIVVAVLGLLLAPQTPAPTLEAVLAHAGQFAISLQKTRVLAADENYVQIYRYFGDPDHAVTSGSAPPLGEWGGHSLRKIRSQFILLAESSGDGGWLAFRDAFEVDGKRLRTDAGRLEPLFAGGTDDAIPAAEAASREAVKHNKGIMAQSVHAPTFALVVLSPVHQSAFQFAKKDEKKVNGQTVWVVSYTEAAGGAFARTIEGVPQPLRGELWIEPSSGRVVKTTVVMDSLDAYPEMRRRPERYEAYPRMTFEVTYSLEAKLNLWLPRELKENYDRRTEVVTTTATYSNYRLIETK